MRTLRRGTQIARKLGQTASAAGSRGVAFIAAVFVTFAVGMMLFGFVFLSQSEVGFAAFNRNSTQALGLAEAGVQEGLKRLFTFGALPGTTTFTNSLASSSASAGGSGAVAYQAAFQSNSNILPILSTARFAGSQRAVRVFAQVTFKTGLGSIIFGPQVTFQGDAQPISGDSYAQSGVSFQQYVKSPLCSSGATATNLIPPQVMGGTTISAGSGPSVTPPCGGPSNKATGPYTAECADGSPTEVAPTACSADGGRAKVGNDPLPVNWHPMTPIGMSSIDFTALITWITTNAATASTYQLATVQATQSGTGVTYSPAGTYTPSYWSSIPTTNGKVMLVTAGKPVCVNSAGGTVQLPSPDVSGTCAAGYHYYGNQSGGAAKTTRFLDWGLVTDDFSRTSARTFFQAPSCTTCNGGGPNGNPNGIRYIPLLPTLNVVGLACLQNVNPGINVFDQVNTGDGVSCANPPTQTISTTSATFSGTKSSPEALVIDNAGMGMVQIFGSIPGPGSCSGSNFNNYNWGLILATGDLDLQGNLVLTGLIYTPGNVISHGTVVVRGGIYSANVQGSSAQVNQVDSFGTVNFCAASTTDLLLSPLFFNFQAMAWQDRPLNQR